MKLRHLVLTALAVGAGLMVLQAAAPSPRAGTTGPEPGSVNIVATQAGMGAWASYTVTVRNLSEKSDLVGRMLLLKRPSQPVAALPLFTPIKGGPVAPAPFPAISRGAGPDGAFEFALAVSPRHKRTFTFFAPSDFSLVVVKDASDRLLSEAAIDDRASVGVGLLTDSQTLAASLASISIGDLRVRLRTWDDRQRFPARAVELSGLS
ncbi:MAG: hypothetical protein M3Z13_06205, partial [Candidatus Dormibacteraeota bacterium]|nr:hypothetical protein [Candidatus Dormibacteraeota bacterium]